MYKLENIWNREKIKLTRDEVFYYIKKLDFWIFFINAHDSSEKRLYRNPCLCISRSSSLKT